MDNEQEYYNMKKMLEENNMTMDNYQKLAMRTKSATQVPEEILLNAVMGIAGEAGEVVDEMKKVYFQGHEFDVESIMFEVGDILWYIALMCEGLGCSMSEVAEMNIEKLKIRYPGEGFTTEDSINR